MVKHSPKILASEEKATTTTTTTTGITGGLMLYSPAGGPVLPKRLPQLNFFGCQAVQQHLLCILGKHRGSCLLPKVHAAMDGVTAGLVDQAEWCEQEVNQLWGVGVMDVSLQLGLRATEEGKC